MFLKFANAYAMGHFPTDDLATNILTMIPLSGLGGAVTGLATYGITRLIPDKSENDEKNNL